MASAIIQIYLKYILDAVFHKLALVRMCVIELVLLIVQQGLVHPMPVSDCLQIISPS